MNIFGICLVKDEADIIKYCLQEATKWADKVFVYDNGSSDGTWEIVQELTKTNKRVVPYKQEAVPFRDNLRAKVFNHYRHLASDGDWWCFRLDSDEFYIDNPREFLPTIPKRYHVIWKASFDYRLTYEDVEEFTFTDSCPHDALQLKYYNPLLYSEARFFKHRTRLKWPSECSFPKNMGIVAPQFIRQKHLQYRSPNQIQKRLDKKREATKSGYKYFGKHDNEESWKDVLEHRDNLILDDGSWNYRGFKYPDIHRKTWKRRIFESIMHGLKIYP